MVVYALSTGDGVTFADDYAEAKNKKMDIECGLGGYAELYGREEREDGCGPEYVLIEV